MMNFSHVNTCSSVERLNHLPTFPILVSRMSIHPAIQLKTCKSLLTLLSIIPHIQTITISCLFAEESTSPHLSLSLQSAPRSKLPSLSPRCLANLLMTSVSLVSPSLFFPHDHSQSDHTECESDHILLLKRFP